MDPYLYDFYYCNQLLYTLFFLYFCGYYTYIINVSVFLKQDPSMNQFVNAYN